MPARNHSTGQKACVTVYKEPWHMNAIPLALLTPVQPCHHSQPSCTTSTPHRSAGQPGRCWPCIMNTYLRPERVTFWLHNLTPTHLRIHRPYSQTTARSEEK